MAARFGRTDDGRTTLTSAAITFDGAAIVTTDALDGRLLWSDNHRTPEPLRDRPTSVAVGPFGPAGVPTVSVAWSSGRLTLHDAGRGTRPFAVEGDPERPVIAQRFVTADHGGRLLTIRRQAGVVVLTAGAGGRARLLEVRSGTTGRGMRRRNKAVVGAH